MNPDVVGIFKTETLDYMVLCIHAKDWFQDGKHLKEHFLDNWENFYLFLFLFKTSTRI